MLWIKSFHLITMVCWFAGLFYLPRLFVYHCDVSPAEQVHYKRFCTMEQKLFWGIMTPSAILTIGLGLWLVHGYGKAYFIASKWLHWKILAVIILVVYHIMCGLYIKRFKHAANQHSGLFYRWFNEFPVIILITVILLAILKPF